MANWDVKTANSSLEFDTADNSFNACYALDSNHFINFWTGTSTHGQVQTFTVNTTTWAVTTAAALLEFDTTSGQYNSCCIIDTNHFINFWTGADSDGFAQIFTVNTTTFAVTTANSALEFDTQDNLYNSCFKLDANHVINFWQGLDGDGMVQIFAINTTTWAVTTAGAVLEFDTQSAEHNSCFLVDANHCINFWGNAAGTEAYVQIFAIDTSTWAVTTAGASLKYFFDTISANSCFQIDSTHFINFWQDRLGIDGEVQVFTVSTSTWAVTTANKSLSFSAIGNYSSCQQVDANHFINFYAGDSVDGYAQVFTVNTSTWAVTTSASRLEFDTDSGRYNSCAKIDTNHFINFWEGLDADGFVQVFTVELGTAGPANLKTLNTNTKSNIKTINTATIANTKTYNTIT